jgi:putative membrane protein insertion efficiency factor
MSMIKKTLIRLIYAYQWLFRPLLGNHCRFSPSCSEYTQEAIEVHGVLKGLYLGGRRIVRCAPWSLGGYDPVPKKNKAKM